MNYETQEEALQGLLDEDGVTHEAEADDDGIGPHEFWGARYNDSRPVIRVYVEEQDVTIAWLAPTPEVGEELHLTHSFSVDDGDPVEVELDCVPKNVAQVSKTTEGWLVAQTFTVSGEGSRSGRFVRDCDD